jgi:hypothetical protein
VAGDATGHESRRRHDERLDQFALVLCVDIDGEARGYPLDDLHRGGGVLVDELAGVEIVVVAPPGRHWAANVFERPRSEEDLQLTMEGDALVEPTTGRSWDVLGRPTGAIDAPRLQYLRSGVEKWHALSGLKPNLELWAAKTDAGSWSPDERG